MKESTVGNAPLKNTNVAGKTSGEGQKTGNANKAFGTLVNQQQEGDQPAEPNENAGFQRAMSKLQEKLLGGDALKEPGQPETLHAEKMIKGLEEQKGDQSEFLLGQTLPLSTYLEAVGKPPEIQPPPVQGGLNIAHIEKLVDQMLVGVNATGDPEIKLSLHVPELGQLQVKITRGEDGLSIHLNSDSEKAGVQLGQNMTVLQSTLAQRGLQVQNIELLVQNQPVPLSEFVEAVRPAFDAKTLRKDPTTKVSREGKKDRPGTGPPPKGR